MPILRLTRDLWERSVAIARAGLPFEVCALIAGAASDGLDASVVVSAVHPVTNALRSPTAFALDGVEMMAAEDTIDADGKRVVGVLHSHPTSAAVPSPRDLDDARVYDPAGDLLQVIVSMQGFSPVLRAFRYDPSGGDPHEIDVIVSS